MSLFHGQYKHNSRSQNHLFFIFLFYKKECILSNLLLKINFFKNFYFVQFVCAQRTHNVLTFLHFVFLNMLFFLYFKHKYVKKHIFTPTNMKMLYNFFFYCSIFIQKFVQLFYEYSSNNSSIVTSRTLAIL